MAVASTGTTLELRTSSLRDIKARIRPLFRQGRMAVSAGHFLDGLLGDERRKTGWMRVGAAGDPGPWRQRAILGRGRWDADALRGPVREYALGTLADADATLVLDETGFLKKGSMSCGVARQYTGSAGKVTNCRAGVFAFCVSRHGHAFIDRGLYLPKAWADDPARLAGAHVPDGTGFATGPAIALSMVGRATGADVPFRRVAADRLCGVASMGKNPGRPERAVFPGRGLTTGSPRGASRRPLPEPPRGPPGTCRRGRGGVCRRVTARKAGDCMTGSASSWPIWISPEPGPVACRVAARSPRAISPFSPHGVPPAQTSGNPAGWRGAAGR